MGKYAELWDDVVQPFAMKLIQEATVDRVQIEENLGAMIFWVNHDLGDDRIPGGNGGACLCQVRDVFSSAKYLEEIHSNTPIAEKERMQRMVELIDRLLEAANEEREN